MTTFLDLLAAFSSHENPIKMLFLCSMRAPEDVDGIFSSFEKEENINDHQAALAKLEASLMFNLEASAVSLYDETTEVVRMLAHGTTEIHATLKEREPVKIKYLLDNIQILSYKAEVLTLCQDLTSELRQVLTLYQNLTRLTLNELGEQIRTLTPQT